MKKIVGLLIISIIVVSVVSGLLFYQLNAVQDENSNLRSQLFEVNTQLDEEQNYTLQLESQVTELENQKAQLGSQTTELQNQTTQLESQVAELTNEINQFEGQVIDLNNQIGQLEIEIFELERQRDELQNVLNNIDIVNITEFIVYSFNPIAGLTIVSTANITIKNNGIKNITDLVLTLDYPATNDSKSLTIEIIHPGEEVKFSETVSWILNENPTWFATLSKGAKILDECTATFSTSYR